MTTLGSEAYSKIIRERASRWHPTLCRTNHTIHVAGAIHKKAMEMNGRRLISEVILQIDDYPVANGSFNSWNRPLPIDANDWSFEESVRVCPNPLGGKIVYAGGGFSKRAEGEGTTDKEVRK